MKLIGLCGQIASGKNTIAKILIKNRIIDYEISFAESLKKHCKDLFGETNREYLQKLGAFGRSIDKDIWINKLILTINYHESVYRYWNSDIDVSYVITDVRYLNEADWIINRGGILIIINISSGKRHQRAELRDGKEISIADWVKQSSHLSETEFVDIMARYSHIGYVFNNNETLTDDKLEKKFIKWYQKTVK